MNEFEQNGNVFVEDFMINILNNLPEEHDVILDGLENCLTAKGENVFTIDTICKKMNHRYEKVEKKTKNTKKKKQ